MPVKEGSASDKRPKWISCFLCIESARSTCSASHAGDRSAIPPSQTEKAGETWGEGEWAGVTDPEAGSHSCLVDCPLEAGRRHRRRVDRRPSSGDGRSFDSDASSGDVVFDPNCNTGTLPYRSALSSASHIRVGAVRADRQRSSMINGYNLREVARKRVITHCSNC